MLAAVARAQERPSASAVRIAEPPTLDGEVLNDPVWKNARPAVGFVQVAPFEGEPGSEQTEVRIAYTETTLYFGVICYDREPGGIVLSDARRDSPLESADSFQIIIDTYQDRQNGFVFGTNPAGLEYDGQVANEGQGTGMGGGTGVGVGVGNL